MVKALNELTNYLVDFSRPGSLFFGNHRYSNKELAERFFVVTTTALAGYWQWYSSESITEAGAAATFGFLVSHTITMAPLICKRLEKQWACDQLATQIKIKTKNQTADFIRLVNSVVKQVLTHADVKSASEVWGKRERLLTHLSNWLNTDVPIDELTELLEREDIIKCLDKEHIEDIGRLEIQINPARK